MKTPVPPLYLLAARVQVNDIISKKLVDHDLAAVAIRRWHQAVQKWQDTEELDQAFSEGRLTHRTMTHEGKAYDLSKEDEDRRRVLGIINNDDHQKPILNLARKDLPRVGEQRAPVWVKTRDLAEKGKTVLLDAGGAGIMRRLNPQNFLRPTPATPSSKFRLGLHTLSGSLLNPDGYVLKNYSETTLVVLMPLPLPEDVKIFYQLRALSKTGGCTSFRNAVVILASEFTRPQIGSSGDMGAQYVITTSERHGGESVKYVKGSGPKVTSQDSPVQCAVNVRENYRDILNGDIANEITIAYRKHGTRSKFPVFAICPKDSEEYIEVNIKLAEAEGGYANYEKTGYLISGKDFTKKAA